MTPCGDDVEVRPRLAPLRHHPADVIEIARHGRNIPSGEILCLPWKQIRLRLALLTAVAPAAWGSTYLVTETFLPPDRPLFAARGAGAADRPACCWPCAGSSRRGGWWWRAVVLGLLNIGMFFPLIFLAAYHLPGGLAATLQATSPMAVMALAWPGLGERPGWGRVGAALVGAVGVALLVLRSPGQVDAVGLAAAFGSVLVSALGYVLVKRWPAPVDNLTLVSWQLVVGGLLLAAGRAGGRGCAAARSTCRPSAASCGWGWWAPAWRTTAGSWACAACPRAWSR